MSESSDARAHLSGRPLLFTGFVVTGFVTTLLGPVLPWLTARWMLSDAAAGALFTIQFTGSIVAGALSGLVVARLGSSATLSTGYALMAAGLAGLALGERATGTLGIGVAGVGLGFVVPATNLIVARLTPDRAAAALGGLNFCWGLGAATWPVIVARFNPVPGVPVALLVVSGLLLVMSARMATARFPLHVLRRAGSSAPGTWSWRPLTILGLCIAIYSGVESAFGGWIAEYTRRLTADTSTMRWETAASAFWGGLAGGRGLVAVGLARRFETVAMFSGLALVAAAMALLLVASGPVAGLCRGGGVRLRPVAVVSGDDGSALAGDAAERGAADDRARLARRGDGAVARRRHLEPHRLLVERAERAARAAGRARRPPRRACNRSRARTEGRRSLD